MLLNSFALTKSHKLVQVVVIIGLAYFLVSGNAYARTLTKDTTWQGVIELEEDILIPEGITLTILPATAIKVHPALSTKTDPEYVSHLTEITIRGKLSCLGQKDAPITFSLADPNLESQWAGIIVDQGNAQIAHTSINKAETAIQIFDGQVTLENSVLADNRYGITGYGKNTSIILTETKVQNNDFGILALAGANIEQNNSHVSSNNKNDIKHVDSNSLPLSDPVHQPADNLISRMYKNDVLLGTTIWQGQIIIEGLVRLPEDARLIILPGTLIEFTKRDRNDDGIGENGMMIQGTFLAKGTPDKPIIFRSAEKIKKRGDWDSINILGSDKAQNLMEFCQIQDAYRGMHFHFSNVVVNNCTLHNNYRGIQFQESLVTIKNSSMFDNKSGIRARDSQVIFNNNRIYNNINGANFFRLDLLSTANTLANNSANGLRIREGAATVANNIVVGNRVGLLINKAEFGRFSQNLLSHNLEHGLAMRDSNHLEISGNSIQSNAINGIAVRDSRAAITNNLIADNGERGIGAISFSGEITQNNITANRLYAIGLDNESNLSAPHNWWGTSDLQKEIYDKSNDPCLGVVDISKKSKKPFSFTWPVANIALSTTWHGKITVPQTLIVAPDALLAIKPGTNIDFAPETGLEIFGKIQAQGTPKQRIAFSSMAKQASGDWQEIMLDRAMGSKFINCDFEYATWGIHSHFVNLIVRGCTFKNNYGGLRFRSGPVNISQSIFINNKIGIRSFLGNGGLNNNIFRDNEVGVFIRQGGSGLQIHHNNLAENKRYGIRLGDFNSNDVDATNNWWGITDPQNIIFDGRNESYIGRVNFNPVLKKPVMVHGYD